MSHGVVRRCVVAGLLLASVSAAADAPRHRRLNPGEVLRGRFVQERQMQGFARPLASQGSFVLVPAAGLIWRTESPFAVDTIITASGLVQQVDGVVTTRLKSSRLPFLVQFYHMLGDALAGDWKSLDTVFAVTQHDDARGWEVGLTPLPGADPSALPFRAITLHGSTFVEEVLIRKPDGDSDRLRFSGQTVTPGGPSAAEAMLLTRAGE